MVPAAGLEAALSRIAGALSESLDLRTVFERVSQAAREVLPFDGMGISRLEGPDGFRLYALTGDRAGDFQGRRFPLDACSPRARPDVDETKRIDDTVAELDPSYPFDREVLEFGARSILSVPLRHRRQLVGRVFIIARRPAAFTPEHASILQPITDLLAVALEHERIWAAAQARRERLRGLDRLLPTIAGVLDVRAVFAQVSEVVQEVIPHDHLLLTEVGEDRLSMRLRAVTGEACPDAPDSIPLTEGELERLAMGPEIIRDALSELPPPAARARVCASLGIRSALRIPIFLEGAVSGSVVFLARSPGAYGEDDVEPARRVADYLALALSHQRLAEEARVVAEARARAARLEARVEMLTQELESRGGYGRVVGRSRIWRDVLRQATKVAATETTVLLTGESGTGKEVVARFVHRGSRRAEGPFVAINCAALPEQLLESELFGHEKGAFTGAVAARPGRLEQAAGGTLFLDEVGEMSPAVQAKLLRVLQEREFQRLGGARPLKADVRIVAATNRDLEQAIRRGEFREDLLYRLRVFEITPPPLRERPEDILPLAELFLEEIGREIGHPAAGISKEARQRLLAYGWPGNVRELRNALERAAILCDGGLIAGEHLPIAVGPSRPAGGAATTRLLDAPLPRGGIDLNDLERALVRQAIEQSRHNKTRAAKLLGLTRAQLYSRIEKYGLE